MPSEDRHQDPEPLPTSLDGRILDHPVWWIDRNGRALAVQVLHLTQVLPGEADVRWQPDTVDVLLEFRTTDTASDRGRLAELTTCRVELSDTVRGREVRIFADGIPVPSKRLAGQAPPTPTASAEHSSPKVVQELAPAGVDGLRTAGSVVIGCAPVTFEHVSADEVLAAELDLEIGHQVLHIERVWSANGEPLLLESCHLRRSPFAHARGTMPATVTLREAFLCAFGEVVAHSETCIEVTTATHREAELTGTRYGEPMLVEHSISYTAAKSPMFRARAAYRGDRVALAVEQHHVDWSSPH